MVLQFLQHQTTLPDMTTPPTLLALNLADLALFGRIVATGSLSAAARERQAPTSQVTRALARLEAACGARLLHRSTHALSLTPEGKTVLRHAQALLQTAAELQGALGSASGRAGAATGWVRIAVSAVVAQAIVVPSLPDLYDRHPGLRLDIAADDHVVDLVRDGIDIALRTGDPGSEGFVARAMGTLTRSLYASPTYVQRHGLPREVDDLAHHRLLTNTATAALNRWRFEPGDGQPGRELVADGHTRTDNTAVLVGLAVAGVGIARIADRWARPLVKGGALVPVLPGQTSATPATLNAVMLPGRQRLPKVRAVLDHLQAWMARE